MRSISQEHFRNRRLGETSIIKGSSQRKTMLESIVQLENCSADNINVSADEIDDRTLSFPMPYYLETSRPTPALSPVERLLRRLR
jgi:hypothetical protein